MLLILKYYFSCALREPCIDDFLISINNDTNLYILFGGGVTATLGPM